MSRDFNDPRIPNRNECVLRYQLDRWAAETPDKIHIIFENGEAWSFAEVKRRTIAVASGFAALGVTRGDKVAVWLPNGREAILSLYALNYIGAVFVPFNTAYRGNLLAHVIANSDARLLVAHADLAPRLGEVDRGALTTAVLVGGNADEDFPLAATPFEMLAASAPDLPDLDRPIDPWDLQSIIYTSGTTGPSKGVLSSYLHLYTNAGPESWPMVKADDRYLTVAPIFHIGGMGPPVVMLARGASVAIVENFTTDSFLATVKRTEATVIFLLGVMATFLVKRPPSPEDRDHGVRTALMVPLTDDAALFKERFGIDVFTIFNMTEISSPVVSDANPSKIGTCGKVREGVEVRLVNENDCEVAIGEIGEMLVRTDRPWAMNGGYYKDAEATAKAWRNGWFHTGDAFRQDKDGYFYFVDRVKDAIRRRGENISSFEVEVEVCAHPAVREAAAIGVPSEYSEDDVMIVVAPVPGQTVDPAALIAFLADRMPYFMIPRYVRVLDELPKTPSAKVQKAALRSEGVTADCWDREKSGISIKRDRIGGSKTTN